MQGSCGYGVMDKTKYPYWSVAALSQSNPFYVAGPTGACGQCFEVQCLNSGGQFAVRQSPCLSVLQCTFRDSEQLLRAKADNAFAFAAPCTAEAFMQAPLNI